MGQLGKSVMVDEEAETEESREPKAAMPEEALSQPTEAKEPESEPVAIPEPTPEEAAAQPPDIEEAAPEEGAPEEAPAEKAAPEEGAPEPAPEEAAPEASIEEAAPEEGAPEEVAPEEVPTEEPAPEEAVPEVPAEEAPAEEAAPEEVAPEGAPTEEPASEEAAPEAPTEEVAIEEAAPEETAEETRPEGAQVDFDLLETEGRWLLKVLSGPNSGAEFAMHGGSSYLIGTDTDQCDVVFQDLSVSRKHARLTIDLKNEAILEDLESRNGTFVDGERIDKRGVTGNVLVAMGTTTFMLVDREAEQTTIISPLHVEAKEEEELQPIEEAAYAPIQAEVDRVKEEEEKHAKESQAMSSLVVLAIVTALILVVGIGGALLFRTETITAPKVVNPEEEIAQALEGFVEVRFSYNPTNNRLMLVGHVLTSTDRSKMLDLLQRLKFIRVIDYSNVVIDEHVWREANQILSKNPAWRGITITSPRAGHYVLSGFLKTRGEAQSLYDYISQNFEYVNLLERRVVVEEELLNQLKRELREAGFPGVTPTLVGGDLMLKGQISRDSTERFQKLLSVFKTLPGIRSVQSTVAESGKVEAVIDLTNKYRVSGFSKQGDSISVVINGRILAPGDTIDGKLITSISDTTIYLEDGTDKYKIDFNR